MPPSGNTKLQQLVIDHDKQIALMEQKLTGIVEKIESVDKRVTSKLDSIDKKLDMYTMMSEVHGAVTGSGKSMLHKWGSMARDITSVIMVVILFLMLLAILLKLDFSHILH